MSGRKDGGWGGRGPRVFATVKSCGRARERGANEGGGKKGLELSKPGARWYHARSRKGMRTCGAWDNRRDDSNGEMMGGELKKQQARTKRRRQEFFASLALHAATRMECTPQR